MAVVQTIEIDGTRHAFNPADVEVELRCDGCGQYASATEALQVTATAERPRVNVQTVVTHWHETCLHDEAGKLGIRLLAALLPS